MMGALMRDLRQWTRVADIGKLTQPLLFIRGEHDYVTSEDVDVYAKASARSETATIADAAHLAFVDNPDATNEVVRRFLNRIER
jgi:pimeloyl-ACP methyl ester carboxylesterase